MKRVELKELHYMTAISNLPSIWRNGILFHRRASKYQHDSIASKEMLIVNKFDPLSANKFDPLLYE